MGEARQQGPVKLVVGLLLTSRCLLPRVRAALQDSFGASDCESRWLPFTWTRYYHAEMGDSLWRGFLSFGRLIRPERLASAKLRTNEIEQQFLQPGRSTRAVNLDPGYVTLAKLVLATTKNFAHRVYLQSGIFAEVTLYYSRKEGFQPWPWTYPDYCSREYRLFFHQVRGIYQRQLSIQAGTDE